METTLKKIDEAKLEEDIAYRFQYLCEFIGFGEEDIKNITSTARLLTPIAPALVDAVYDKLFSYDCTKRHFMLRQFGYEGSLPKSLEGLTQNHELIQFRKEHLAVYIKKLVTGPYDEKMVKYLDFVGQIHTKEVGNPELNVPLIQMNALMGFVADAINAAIFKADLPYEETEKTVRSFSKLLWIQNDLINRHYQG